MSMGDRVNGSTDAEGATLPRGSAVSVGDRVNTREDSRGLAHGGESSSALARTPDHSKTDKELERERELEEERLRFAPARQGAPAHTREAAEAGFEGRPIIDYEDSTHRYRVNGERAVSVSRVAKVGADVWGPASAWGWRIGRDGALLVLREHPEMTDADVDAEMSRRGLTPWATRDKAADRGNDVHDILEALAQDGTVPDLDRLHGERRGHALSLVRWYRRFRPSFDSTEVIVGSAVHGFAGRYDIRALFETERLLRELDWHAAKVLEWLDPLELPEVLGLGDLKTSKRVMPRQHFAQLDGYEEGSIECGYRPSDFRFVIRTRPDGECAEMAVSWAPRGTFLGYLAAVKAMEALDWQDPKAIAKREKAARYHAQEVVVLQGLQDHGPITARKLAVPMRPWEPKALSKVLQRLKRQGKAECKGRTWEATTGDA